MYGDTLQQQVRERIEELPGSELSFPFGPDCEVYKVRDKVFALMTEVTGEPVVVVKAAPHDAVALRDQYADITPGYHMNKRHWITLNPGGELGEQLVEDLVTESYLLVVERLPRARRPVDHTTFAGAEQ